MLILEELEEFLPALPGVRILLLKGLALLYLYSSISARPLSDADVLVDPRDLPEIRRRLTELGFQAEPVHSEAYDLECYQELSFVRPSGQGVFRLDLHWGLTSAEWLPTAGIPTFEEMWSRSRPGPLALDRARIPSSEDTLLHLCLHLALHHAFEETAPLVDVAVLVGSFVESGERRAESGEREEGGETGGVGLDWDLFLELAGRSGWGPAAYVALERARTLAGAPVPEAVLRRLRPPRWQLWTIEMMAPGGRPVGHQASRLLQLALVERPGTAAAMVGRALFPPESWLRLRYPAHSRRGLFALRLIHLARVVKLAGRAVAQAGN